MVILIFCCVGLTAPPPQQTFYLLSIAGTHLYTWVEKSNYSKVPFSWTQEVDHNGAGTHNLLLTNPALIRQTTRAHITEYFHLFNKKPQV